MPRHELGKIFAKVVIHNRETTLQIERLLPFCDSENVIEDVKQHELERVFQMNDYSKM